MRTYSVAALAAILLAGGAWATPRVVDRVVATVNDEMIPLSEVHERARPELARLEQEGQLTSERRDATLKRALDDLIAERLLTAEQSAHSIEVTEQDVDFAVDDVRKQNGMDAATFERALAAQGQNITAYRQKMKRDLAAMKLIGMKVRSKVKVSEEDVKAEYARQSNLAQADVEIHAQHIVIQVPKDAAGQAVEMARLKALELAKRARAGEDFTALAKQNSEGASREDGGDVGFFKRGEMVGPFEKAAFAMKDGEVSDPVRTPFGWHVIKVIERRAGKAPPYEEVRAQLQERLMREQMARQTDQYVAELREKASVEIKTTDLR